MNRDVAIHQLKRRLLRDRPDEAGAAKFLGVDLGSLPSAAAEYGFARCPQCAQEWGETSGWGDPFDDCFSCLQLGLAEFNLELMTCIGALSSEDAGRMRRDIGAKLGEDMDDGQEQHQMATRVLVYGSLKRGFHNHPLLEHARFLGPASTPGQYRLYSLGDYPAAVEAPRGGYALHGELYQVDSDTLARLDRLEGHPEYFRRKQVKTTAGPAWLYLLPTAPESANELLSGTWT